MGPVDPSKEFCKPGVPYRSFNKHCVALTNVSLVYMHIYFSAGLIAYICRNELSAFVIMYRSLNSILPMPLKAKQL